MDKVIQLLLSTIPKIKTGLQLSAFLVTAAILLVMKDSQPNAILVKICLGGIALVIIVFAQIFTYIKDFPETSRGRTVIVLFSTACTFILILACIAVYNLNGAPTVKPTADEPKINKPKAALFCNIQVARDQDRRKPFTFIQDGDTVSRRDAYRLVVLPQGADSMYIYVVQQDSRGQVNWLFPGNELDTLSRGKNPVAANSWLLVPAKDSMFGLDNHQGIETIYVFGSYRPRPGLEMKIGSMIKEAQPVMDTFKTQGPAGFFAIPAEKTEKIRDEPAFASFYQGEDSLVIAKWFYHRK
jgi:heme/copper-type cytochrome/quinol oxidase subunit 4